MTLVSFGDISEFQEKLLPGRVHDVVNPRLRHVTHSWFYSCDYNMLLHSYIVLQNLYRIVYTTISSSLPFLF